MRKSWDHNYCSLCLWNITTVSGVGLNERKILKSFSWLISLDTGHEWEVMKSVHNFIFNEMSTEWNFCVGKAMASVDRLLSGNNIDLRAMRLAFGNFSCSCHLPQNTQEIFLFTKYMVVYYPIGKLLDNSTIIACSKVCSLLNSMLWKFCPVCVINQHMVLSKFDF